MYPYMPETDYNQEINMATYETDAVTEDAINKLKPLFGSHSNAKTIGMCLALAKIISQYVVDKNEDLKIIKVVDFRNGEIVPIGLDRFGQFVVNADRMARPIRRTQ